MKVDNGSRDLTVSKDSRFTGTGFQNTLGQNGNFGIADDVPSESFGQARIIGLLVERVDVRNDRVDIKLQLTGITSLVGELTGNSIGQKDAA